MSEKIHETDICIIGAGPVGLFAVFQCGMLGMRCHVVDSLDMIGGQCSALYPEKPIYDIPAYPQIMAQELIDNLVSQAQPFQPIYHLSQSVVSLQGDAESGFQLITSAGTHIHARAVIIAAGAGAFGPNKPPLKDLEYYEGHSVFYMVKKRQEFAQKNILISGGGDSAVDWAVSLAEIAQSVTVIHRRDVFRAAPDMVQKLRTLAEQGRIKIITPAQPVALIGQGNQLEAVRIRDDDAVTADIPCDVFLPFYGLVANLSMIAEWGIDTQKNRIIINPTTAQTNKIGVYAIGDVAVYEHKLKLILIGFAEAAAAAHHAYGVIYDGKAYHFEYSTTKKVPIIPH